MFKKPAWSLTRILSMVLLCTLMLVSFAQTAAGDTAKTYQFNLAHFFPATHNAETILVQGWIEAIDEATDGQVKITSYPGGTLLAAADIYNGVVQGIADIGLACFSYTRGRFPVLEAFELPGITYMNSKSASMVAWEGVTTLNPPEVQDTHLMMVIATGPGDLFTKIPVRTLADLQGMEIRATGLSAKTLSLLGGTPVGMTQNEAYEALQRGVVQGNLSPVEVLKDWNQAEVTDYITLTPFLYNTLFCVTFNQEKWDSMPQDLQDKVTAATAKFHEEVGIGLWDASNEPAMEYAVNEMGMEVITLSDEEKAIWIEKVLPLQEEYTNSVAGLTDIDVISYINELAAKYNLMYAGD
ncbi:MAG: TRAP transporter substrate-binding protein [Clostridiales bacterium]|nr:TRAP transporter substrate-binding protein [Clostridiales bacterium]